MHTHTEAELLRRSQEADKKIENAEKKAAACAQGLERLEEQRAAEEQARVAADAERSVTAASSSCINDADFERIRGLMRAEIDAER